MSRGLFKKLWAVIGVIGVVFGIITSITGVGLYPMVSGFLTSHRIPLWVYILTVITIVALVCVKPLSKLVGVTLLRAKEVGQNSSRAFVAQPKSSTQLPFQQHPQQSKGSGEHWAWPEKPNNVFLKFCYFIIFPLLPSTFIAILFSSMCAWILNTLKIINTLFSIIPLFLSIIFFLLIYILHIIISFYQNKQSQIRDKCGAVLGISTGISCICYFLGLITFWMDKWNIPLIANIIVTSIVLCILAILAASLIDLYKRA